MNLRFASDLFPWLPIGVAVALTLAFALEAYWRRRTLARLGDPSLLRRMMASYSPFRRRLKIVLVVVGLTLVAVALCRPQRLSSVTWRKRGIDVAVTLDLSKSMLARDVYPDRLTRMTEEVNLLIDQLASDRVAVVVFAGGAAHFPLSEDTQAARSLFQGLTNCPLDAQDEWPSWCAPSALAPGSDLTEALLTARCVLRPDLSSEGCERVGGHGRGGAPLAYDDEDLEEESELVDEEQLGERARAIVLFTDGGDMEGGARAEVERAVELGVSVFIVGVGTPEGELIPEYDALGAQNGWKKSEDGASFVTSRLDQAALLELAQAAGGEGRYFWLDPQRFEVSEVVDQLRRLKQGDLDGRLKKEWTDVFELPLFVAFMLLLIEATISGRKRRVVYPEEQAR